MVEISPPGRTEVPVLVYVEGTDAPGGTILLRIAGDPREPGGKFVTGLGARLSPIQAIAYGNDLVREGLAALDHPDARKEAVTYRGESATDEKAA